MIIRFQRNLRGAGKEAVHASSFIRKRRMLLDADLLEHSPELVRIFVHELFHFAWARLDNRSRRDWETLVMGEVRGSVPGELGYSAAWRKEKILQPGKPAKLWRDYVCESFCDTAAWYFSPRDRHDEVTLPAPARRARASWFRSLLEDRKLPV